MSPACAQGAHPDCRAPSCYRTGLPGIAAAAHSTKTTPGQSLQQQNQTLAVSHGVASPPQQQDTNSSSISTTGASGDAGGMQQPVAGDQQQVPADSIHGSSVTLGSSSGGSEEVGEANLEGGPGHVDTIGAEVAARPADDLPSKYPVKGLIDVQAPIFSGEAQDMRCLHEGAGAARHD